MHIHTNSFKNRTRPTGLGTSSTSFILGGGHLKNKMADTFFFEKLSPLTLK